MCVNEVGLLTLFRSNCVSQLMDYINRIQLMRLWILEKGHKRGIHIQK